MSDQKLAQTAAQRGHNLVCYAPPSPSACRSVLAGLLSRTDPMHPGPILALAPAESVEEWGRVAAETAGASGAVVAARSAARLQRFAKAPELRLAITSPEVAHQLVRRALLKPAELSGIVLLWPEAWGGDALANELLQEVPKETQRIVITADPAGSAGLIERYCWRAAVADLLGAAPADPEPAVRAMPVSWTRRREALVDVVDQLDPDKLLVWLADEADHEAVETSLRGTGVPVVIATELLVADASGPALADAAPPPSTIVAYDLPSPGALRSLGKLAQVVLLVPPGTESYVARLAPERKPLHLQASLAAAEAEVAKARHAISDVLERGPGPVAFHTLAPLLERYEATAVAAALYELWKDAGSRATPAPQPRRQASPRLWMGIGKRDNVTPSDVVAALIKYAGVPREAIGKVEIRESFSLVELGTGTDTAAAAERLAGQTIRKRRLVAKLDQKPSRQPS